MASILYNIAALHTKLAVEESRADPESMKIACTHFQCAAWAFNEMKNQYAHVLKGDLSVELVIFMQQISFAQAQECILEKSLADNRKAAIIAKVTAQVISFYNAALSALFSQVEDVTVLDLIGSKLYKEWVKYINFKTSYLSCILLLYQGMNSEEQRKMGERVALFNAACVKLEEAKKESKGMNNIDVINEALTFATDVVEGKRKNAKQENEFIYHEAIPDISTIAAIQGANLVQGIAFDVTDSQVIGDDIFKRLVPMKTHEHLSVYSEKKANILRGLGAIIDEREAELASFMGSLNLESLNAMKQPQERLPQALVDRCAELSAKPTAVSDLVQSMSNLADICCDVEVTLKDIRKILDTEAAQEQSFQKQMGKRPTGHMAELSREYTKYFDAHNKAGESNDTLRKAMELHVSNLKILGQPLSALKNQVPQADPIDEITRNELEKLLHKVEEMRKQRDELFNDLREQILNQDDITPQLIAHGDKDIEELFDKEMKKYSEKTKIIELNLIAQGNILKALTDTYAKHAMTLKSFNDTKLKREQFYSSLVASYDVYEDLLSKSSKGLDFYKKLHGNVQKLFSRVKGARDVQEEERQQLLKSAMPKAPTESVKSIEINNYKNIMSSVPSSGSGGPKLKDYLKSGMIPGMGGLRDDLSKLPAVRPSPVGQENVSNSNPASCTTMNYSSNNYRNQQQQSYQPTHDASYPLQYYLNTDQHNAHSGSASLSSSTTSLNNEYYNQTGMTGSQGYVNPMYQSTGPQNYQNYATGNFSQPDGAAMTQKSYSTQNYQPTYPSNAPAASPYMNYGANIGQTQQTQAAPYDYYKNQAPSAAVDPSFASQHQQNNNQTYISPQNSQQPTYDQSQGVYQNPYQTPQQYGVAPNPSPSVQQYMSPSPTPAVQQYAATPQQNVAQQPAPILQQQPAPMPQQQMQQPQYPTSQSPAMSAQYTGIQQYQYPAAPSPAPVQIPPVAPSPAPSQASDQQYSMNYAQTPQQQPVQQNFTAAQNQFGVQQDYASQQNYYTNQAFPTNQQGQYVDGYSQQNYSCYTPTVNSVNSYMTSDVSQSAATTQSTNYSQNQENPASSIAFVTHHAAVDSPQRQPQSIPTYSAAVNAMATNNSETCLTQSQQQISSATANQSTASVSAPTSTTAAPVLAPPIAKPAVVKSSNIDLLSGVDFSMTNPTIDNIPTLTPMMSAQKPTEESPIKVLVPQSPVAAPAPVKLNEDLAELDFSSLAVSNLAEPLKAVIPEKPTKTEDLFGDALVLKQFHKEVEGLEKFMETLTVKTLNGVTPLANKWKELQDLLVKDESKRSVSVARLFPDKNRSADSLPYNHARVQLPTATDNYINAVPVRNCGPVGFILTQTPMANTVNDYWEMVWSQKATVLVCLHTANEVNEMAVFVM